MTVEGGNLDAFAAICSQEPKAGDFPLARSLVKKVPIYAGPELAERTAEEDFETRLKLEWGHCLLDGPGVFVIQQSFERVECIDAMTAIFERIIERERREGSDRGDHFGNNIRIWNSVQKTALEAPHLFADYYGNPIIALACRAWLGPHYQLTAQVNIVQPGGKAQAAHRDYHLGFQSDETTEQYPMHAQTMTPFLTLQGAVAHSDMSIASGPTKLLPYSQLFAAGYRTFRNPDYVSYFDQHSVQLELSKGDLLFFNPALFHAAGSNHTQENRVANLLQISSAFGRPMESVNRVAMIEKVYPELLNRIRANELTPRHLRDTIAAVADGYAFPTNLDTDPPLNGNAPATQADHLQEALENQWTCAELMDVLGERARRQQP